MEGFGPAHACPDSPVEMLSPFPQLEKKGPLPLWASWLLSPGSADPDPSPVCTPHSGCSEPGPLLLRDSHAMHLEPCCFWLGAEFMGKINK